MLFTTLQTAPTQVLDHWSLYRRQTMSLSYQQDACSSLCGNPLFNKQHNCPIWL